MSFLSVLGKILSVGEEVAGVFFPVLRPFLGSGKASQVITTGVNDFTQIASVVVGVEAAFQTPGSGSVKLQAAVPQIANIVKTSEALIGHKVANEPEFVAGCTDLTNAVVRILNSYNADNIKGSGQAVDMTKSATPATPTPVPSPAPAPEPVPTSAPQPVTSGVHPLALS